MIEPIYIKMSDGTVSRTKELVEDAVFIDYDYKGNVVGIEVIAYLELEINGKIQETK
jgi:uncharacterized protein YuzE